MKRLLIEALLVVAALVTGLLWSYAGNQTVREEADRRRQECETRLLKAEQSLSVANLRGELGLLLIDVEESNFGKARERSTHLFDRLREVMPTASLEQAAVLTALSQRRDEITTDLATMNPETAAKLRALYHEFARLEPAIEGTDRPAAK